MKTKEEILYDLFAELTRAKHMLSLEGTTDEIIREINYVLTRLECMYEILGDDVPEEYWDEIESVLYGGDGV